MRKLISLIIITLLLCILTTGAFASNTDTNKEPEGCAATLVNNTDKTYIFQLKWIDHPHLRQTKGEPWTKAFGEIAPGESFIISENQSPGLYIIKYKEVFHPNLPTITENFTITAKNKTIVAILIPNKNKPPMLIIFKYDT